MKKVCVLASVCGLILSLLVASQSLAAATWRPARPITLLVPWPAGGSTDMTARILASQMERPMSQRIVIVNSPGGGGAIGMKEVWDR
ncbi:MAG TPA: hypothetical protein VFM39_06630, partial [bacterium]|nr:hypothetical protein [bacterium]